MPWATADDGYQVYYEVNGDSGPVVVFVGGLGGITDAFADITPMLQERYRCVAVDNRGYGRSDKPLPKLMYGMERHARDLRAVLEAAGLAGEKPILVGHSMGGNIVLQYYWNHPDAVSGLVLTGSFASGNKLQEGAGDFDVMQFIKDSMPIKEKRVEFFAASGASERVVMELTKPPTYAFLANMETLFAFNGEERLAEVKVPTFILHGANDIVAPLDPCGTHLHQHIPGAKLQVMETNHCPMMEKPEEFVHWLTQFIDQDVVGKTS